ncbi:molecular chaperone DnaJ [Candidatus Woesearchaeota archaeon]|nr:molecular chaperone DnaJ [Candidatus Woesearchaeota archaeon]
MAKDYYETLGVPRSATRQDIKKAYLKLAKKWHPDLNKEQGASDRFKEINEAASVLGDDRKREQYDRFGSTSSGFGAGAGGFDFTDFGNFADFGFDFGEVFDRFFSHTTGFRQRRQSRGADLHYELEIELEEAAAGTTKGIHIPRLEKCSQCKGTGADSPSDTTRCDNCNGQGMVRQVQRIAFGTFATTTTCGKCGGTGQFIKKRCSACGGEGRTEKSRTIEIKIPAGIDTGNSLRIAGEGEAGERGAAAGDLFLTVRVKPHKIFEREGADLHIQQPLPFAAAALGGEIEVPTLDGTATLKIPSGTQSDTVFRMKEKGLPSLDSGARGSQYVKVVISVPKQLSSRQKSALKEFAREERKGILKRIF